MLTLREITRTIPMGGAGMGLNHRPSGVYADALASELPARLYHGLSRKAHLFTFLTEERQVFEMRIDFVLLHRGDSDGAPLVG